MFDDGCGFASSERQGKGGEVGLRLVLMRTGPSWTAVDLGHWTQITTCLKEMRALLS